MFGKNKRFLGSIVLAGGLTACGGGGGGGDSSNTTLSIIPLESIPISAQGIIELGPISGGSVTLRRNNGETLGSFTTNGDGSINLNPRDIVSKMGSDNYIIATISGGQDTDADDDGFIDPKSTPVNGAFRMIIPRSTLENGEGIIANPRAGLISDILLGRVNPSITKGVLDTLSRQTGAEDQNNDGITDYADIYGVQMKNTTGVSKVVPAISGYIESIHTGDNGKKQQALENVAKTENQLQLRIIKNPDPNNHTPALKIESISGGTILYTLDGSSPLIGGSGTKSATSEVIIPMQDTKLYFREQFVLNGKTILGKVSGFDLMSDWTELAQTDVKYNKNTSDTTLPESFSYKGMDYKISSTGGKISPGYDYPKQIDCTVGSDAGCQFGPYIAWSRDHELQIYTIIHTKVKEYIDSPGIKPISLIDPYKDNVLYKGANYSIIDTWSQGVNNIRTFPVVIDIRIKWNNGEADYISSRTVNNQTDLDRYNTDLEKSVKEYIDSKSGGIKNHSQNEITSFSGKVDPYYGGWYEILYQWNLSGTGDYPTKIIGTYALPTKGKQPNIEAIVYNDTDRVGKSNQILGQIQSNIQSEYNSLPKPNYPKNTVLNSGVISYRGYRYNVITTMNINGNSDYPATVYVSYTTPTGSDKTATLTANNATELSSVQAERTNDAKSRIDLLLDNDRYSPGSAETVTNTTPYGGGSYRTIMTYSLNVGQDYPGYIDTYITYRNGTNDKLTISVDNANQKTTYASTLETQARSQIDNYNPTYAPNTTINDGPHPYGSVGGDYTAKLTYNRTGENKNYPVMIWIEFRERVNGPLLDTRNIRNIGIKYANSSTEKEQMKGELVSLINQRLALGVTDTSTILAMNAHRSLLDIFVSSAHAQTTDSILIQKNPIKYSVSLYDPTTLGTHFYANGATHDLYVKRQENKASIASTSITEIENRAIEEAHWKTYTAIKTELLKKLITECTGQGTTIEGCIDNPLILPKASSQSASGIFKLADFLFGSNGTNQMNGFVKELLKYNKNFIIMYAIIFEEQAHLKPPLFEDFVSIKMKKDSDASIGLSQIQLIPSQSDKQNFGYTDSNVKDLLNPITHLSIMNDRIEKIRKALKQYGKAETPENIGMAWNGGINCIKSIDICADGAIAYGKRVKDYSQSLQEYYNAYK